MLGVTVPFVAPDVEVTAGELDDEDDEEDELDVELDAAWVVVVEDVVRAVPAPPVPVVAPPVVSPAHPATANTTASAIAGGTRQVDQRGLLGIALIEASSRRVQHLFVAQACGRAVGPCARRARHETLEGYRRPNACGTTPRTRGAVMSDIERARIRKEAADDLTSRPPGGDDSRLQAALRRYLGTSLFTMRSRGGPRSQPTRPAGASTTAMHPDDQQP